MVEVDLRPIRQAPVLREQVFDALEELIIEGALPPGERLSESDLADQLGVSRNPVREALTLLAHAGWVDLRPRQGAVVHTPTQKEVEDFFRIRGVLEEESARLAAGRATSADIESLRQVLDEGRAALEEGDESATSRANSAFHGRISDIADNGVLDEVLGLMKKRLRWYFARVVTHRGADSWDEHEELLKALAARDSDRAAHVMRAHSERTARLYRTLHGLEQDAADSDDALSNRQD